MDWLDVLIGFGLGVLVMLVLQMAGTVRVG